MPRQPHPPQLKQATQLPEPLLLSSFQLVDHSASILLVDPQARFYAVFSPPHLANYLASDLKKPSNFYEQTL